MSFATSTPPAVSNTNATSPSARIMSVCAVRKASACILTAMVSPRKSVTRLESVFCAVSDRAVQYAADADQISEHQKSDQRDAARRDDAADHRNKNREQDLCAFGDAVLPVRHADAPLVLRGEQRG